MKIAILRNISICCIGVMMMMAVACEGSKKTTGVNSSSSIVSSEAVSSELAESQTVSSETVSSSSPSSTVLESSSQSSSPSSSQSSAAVIDANKIYNPTITNTVQYKNPVFNETFADPSVIRAVDGAIYAYATQDEWENGKTHYNAILKTKDLINWQFVSDVFPSLPQWNDGTAIWATDIIKIKNKYVFYYTLIDKYEKNPAIGAAVSDNPAGPFTDKGKILDARSFGIFAIDPFPVYDKDGKLYLICGNYEQGSYYIQLSEDGLSTVGEKKELGPGYEGVYIINRNGYYYLFGSLGTVWEGEKSTYHVCVARSKSLLGPYLNKKGEVLTEENKDSETVILKSGTGSRFIAAPGNNSIIKDDNGVDWILYHAVDSAKPLLKNGGTRRPLCIDPIVWDKDGWPSVLNGVPSTEGYVKPYFK